MFNKPTMDEAYPIANSLKSKNQYIKPTSSDISNLLTPILAPVMNTPNFQLTEGNLDTVLAALTTQTMNEEVASDNIELLEKLSESMSTVLISNVELARKVAIPMIADILDNIERKLDETREQLSQNKRINIVINPMYDIFKNEVFLLAINKFDHQTNFDNSMKSIKVFPNMEYEQIKSLLRTGSDAYDTAVANTLNYLGEENVLALFRNLFVKDALVQSTDNIPAMHKKLASNLILFTVCSSITPENIPEGVNLSYKDLQLILLEQRATAGSKLHWMAREYNSKLKSKSVMYDKYTDAKGVTVVEAIADNYEEAQSQGVNTDVVIGALMSSDASLYISELVANATTHIATFNKAVQQDNATLLRSKRDVIINVTNEVIGSTLRANGGKFELSNGDYEIKVDSGSISQKVRDSLSPNVVTDDESLSSMVRNVVCGSLFDSTMVPQILSRMDGLYKSLPEATPEYVAMVTMVTLCVDGLLSQMEIYSSYT